MARTKINNQRPKLLVVTDTFHPKVDGTVRFIEEFCASSSSQFDTSLLAPKFNKSLSSPSITFLPTSKIITPLPNYPSIKLSFKNFAAIKREVQKNDIIFIQGPALTSLLALHYARKYKKVAIAYFHVLPWDLYEKSVKHPLKKWVANIILKICQREYNHANLLLYPYGDLATTMRSQGFIAPQKIARLGVDINRFYPATSPANFKQKIGIDPSQFVVGYVGRISPEKNIKTLIRAFKRLGPNAHLLLIGNGEKEQTEQARKLPNCTITGFVTDVEEYLRAVDVFVMPSLTETTSLATLEAMATGLPVLSSKVGYAQKYIVRNYNGLFFPAQSAAILAKKLEQLKANPKERARLGLNARKTIAYSFSWERSISRIKKLLLEEYYNANEDEA